LDIFALILSIQLLVLIDNGGLFLDLSHDTCKCGTVIQRANDENELPPFRVSINLFALKETRTAGFGIQLFRYKQILRGERVRDRDISADYRHRPQLLGYVKCRTSIEIGYKITDVENKLS